MASPLFRWDLHLDLTEPEQYYFFVGGWFSFFVWPLLLPKREKQKEQKRVQKEKEIADQVLFFSKPIVSLLSFSPLPILILHLP